jgi:hypothetical protein
VFKISQTADEFGSVDRTAQYRYPAMTKTMVPKAVRACLPACLPPCLPACLPACEWGVGSGEWACPSVCVGGVRWCVCAL